MIKNKEQFDFLLELNNKHKTGPNPGDSIVHYTELRILDPKGYAESPSHGDKYSRSKALKERLELTHKILKHWPSETKKKLDKAAKLTGGRTMREETKEATALYIDEGLSANMAAKKAGCFVPSVTFAAEKIKIFDEAAKQYQAMLQ